LHTGINQLKFPDIYGYKSFSFTMTQLTGRMFNVIMCE